MKNAMPAQRLVIKVGSSLVTRGGQGVDQQALNHWADQVAALRARPPMPIRRASTQAAMSLTRKAQRPDTAGIMPRTNPTTAHGSCPRSCWCPQVPLLKA